MTAAEFEGCLRALGWTTRREAAQRLLGDLRASWRITAWAMGRSVVPDSVVQHLRHLLGLDPDDPFPTVCPRTGPRHQRHNPSCLPRDFRYALHLLGLNQEQAAERLGVANRHRVSDWSRGLRPVPRYIECHVRTLLGISPGSPWPTGRKQHPLVLPKELVPRMTISGVEEE